jgi:hypothetical protein
MYISKMGGSVPEQCRGKVIPVHFGSRVIRTGDRVEIAGRIHRVVGTQESDWLGMYDGLAFTACGLETNREHHGSLRAAIMCDTCWPNSTDKPRYAATYRAKTTAPGNPPSGEDAA